jgi:hypothetical protein
MKQIRKCWYFSVDELRVANYPVNDSYKYIGCITLPVIEVYCKEHNYSLIQF